MKNRAPITVMLFNRPDHAAKLRELLRSEESRELFIVSDGPRMNKPGELEQVEACREIFSDWPGTVHFNFADKNMGCRARVSSGISWVFEHAERTIILEDDLQPLPRFFTYCDEMLDAYSENTEIMSICGTKLYPGPYASADLYFSKYGNSWGWATWKRAWAHYDDKFDYQLADVLTRLRRRLGSTKRAIYWYLRIQQILRGQLSSWFYCWMISCFLKDGLHVYPGANLIINQGFGSDSTHTAKIEEYMPIEYGRPLPDVIRFPEVILTFHYADKWIDDYMYSKSFSVRCRWILRKLHLMKDA